MTVVAVARRPDARTEWQSFLVVIATAIVAVAAGLALLSATDNRSRHLERGGVAVDLPAGWVVNDPVGDLLFSAYDPLEPDHRYTVAAIPSAGGTPEDIARSALSERSPLLPGFALVEEGPAAIGDVPTYRVRYTFAPSLDGAGALVEVREDYIADGDRVLVAGLEAPRDGFPDDEAAFERFARQVAASRSAAATKLLVGARLDGRVLVASASDSARPPLAAQAAAGDLIAATVQIFGLRTANDPTSAYGWGSGTVISADGLILTNAHVAKPTAGGLALKSLDPTPSVDPAGLLVAIVEDEAAPAVPRYYATVIAADGYLDAALIRIDRTLDGAPVSPGSLSLPFLPIGDSDTMRVGDPLTVVGFPGIGGDTISLSSGQLSGFLGDPRLGERAWIKTDAVVSQGNSGGLAANVAGELVGLPTMANPDDTGGYSLVRPIALVRPMIDDAAAGRPSLDSRYSVASTGTEQFTFDTWSQPVDDCQDGIPVTSYPSGAREIRALFDYTGVVDGEDLLVQMSIDGEPVLRGLFQFPAGTTGAAGCYAAFAGLDRGLPDGVYTFDLFIGPMVRPVASATTAVGAAAVAPGSAGGSSLAGRVVDVDSGQPVGGAVVFLLTPGTDPIAWLQGPDASRIVGYGQTGADGRFIVAGLTAGTTYPAVVAAEGYHPTTGQVGPIGEGQRELNEDVPLLRAGP
jgi:putative serine protease PepD